MTEGCHSLTQYCDAYMKRAIYKALIKTKLLNEL